jgi:hypothetical protein
VSQYFDGVAEPPLALQELLEPPLALHELLEPPLALQLAFPPLALLAAAAGSVGGVGTPPPQATVPSSIPAIAETVRVFPMFIFPLLTLANPGKVRLVGRPSTGMTGVVRMTYAREASEVSA